MQLGLEGKKALVFGSSGGIGKAIAESLLKEKTHVVVNSRSADKITATVSEFQKTFSSKNVFGVAADLSKRDEATRAVNQAIELMNGLDVLTRMKLHPHTQNLPVLMLTGESKAEDILSGYNVGADYYITKPFTRQQLLYGIQLVFGSKSTRAALELRGHHHATDASEQAAKRIRHDRDTLHRHAGDQRGLRIAAHGIQMPAKGRLRHHYMRGSIEQHHQNHGIGHVHEIRAAS